MIVPVLDEAAAIVPFLARLEACVGPDDEVIVVDGGSRDGTPELAAQFDVRVHNAPRGRAVQMNAGAAAARGKWLLFLHADSDVQATALHAVRAAGHDWGYFRVRLDDRRAALRLIELGINLRSRAWDTPSGDQGIFVRRRVFEELGGYPAVPLLEDLALGDALRRVGAAERASATIGTSARRWRSHGVLRTTLRMWAIRLAYRAGVRPARLEGLYRRRPR
ncbi:TIGR04283 family arsenosugar biosynthesis glycosyltransferase [Planctomycetota bacterium]|nr:TIGR04283 family arsenosugar biosynthesis glycosyltransferase [Planctomycetota bacterium]